MRTNTKIWLGVGAFAVASVTGVTMNGNQPTLTVAQPAQADDTCGWERHEGRWVYDRYCGRGERFNNRSGTPGYYYYNNNRGERWNERGERYNERGERWNEQGQRWEHGGQGERWGERG
ncbi:MAG: hypothetical protein K0S54_1995 [Alphaproteobacteria bacterium]|jgi:hypothetical protein|nr:hypothetical protein [Alphaproteobacteria bacterium]